MTEFASKDLSSISYEQTKSACRAGTAVLIDVREQAEFKEIKLENAINIPSSSAKTENFEPFRTKHICLICHSGRRAKTVGEMLISSGFEKVSVLDEQMQNFTSTDIVSSGKSNTWTIDRQFRMTLGVLLFIGLAGTFFLSSYFLIIPGILSAGLIITALIDRCYMRMGIAMLPWNKGKTA